MLTPSERPCEPTWWTIVRLLRWDKPAGRLILMIPALWAVVLASHGAPPLPLVMVIVLGTLSTSAAGCVVNDLWDRDIDPQVQRTRDRPLAARSLSIQVGIGVALVAFGCAGGLALYLNPWNNPLSFWLCVAAVPVIVGYPLAKRVFPMPQLVLALAWGFAVLISWSAAVAHLELAAWLLWGATILWTLGFDTAYAMCDREDDRRIGVNSSALFLGDYVGQAVAVFFLGTSGLLAYLGWLWQLHLGFWLALVFAVGGWTWQSLRLIRDDLTPPDYLGIFRQNVGLGFLLLLGMTTGFLL
jgi:4-hydroxybenzoate polyprenyltransferase